MKNCPICNGTVEYTTKSITHTYKDHKKQIDQSGYYCKNCGESFLSPKDLKSTQKDISNFKREVDHLLTTEELKRIRKKSHLTQQEAANIFGGGVRAFHKYETAEVTQSKPLDILFRLIDSDKITVEDIKQVTL
ncbi:MAG: type II toxin-antitoxin system MqsA family antitoxin [Campylobacterota bacterium]|nr:type II toxin-antitoxin system MqsA family antitoxin [Campylobacterota bacterium]